MPCVFINITAHHFISSTFLCKKVFEHEVCVLKFFVNKFEIFSFPEIPNDIQPKTYVGLHIKYLLLLLYLDECLSFWTDFRIIFKYQISWRTVRWEKICWMAQREGHTDGQTEGKSDVLVICFHNLAIAPLTDKYPHCNRYCSLLSQHLTAH